MLLASHACFSDAETPLMLAAEEDRPDVVRLLLLHKAHADAMSRQIARMFPLLRESDNEDNRSGDTALALASRRGNTESVAELLRLGAFAGYLIVGCVFELRH